MGALKVLGSAAVDETALASLHDAITEVSADLEACHEADPLLSEAELGFEIDLTITRDEGGQLAIEADVVADPDRPESPEMIDCMRGVLGSLDVSKRSPLRARLPLTFRSPLSSSND